MTKNKKDLVRRPNLGQIAYSEIKEMILTGEIAPGQKIVLDDLSQTLNLSVTPIRDALGKLEQEDLIIATPRTSHSVVKISPEDAAEILDLRLTLEIYALRSAKERLDQFPVAQFKEIFEKNITTKNTKEFSLNDRLFHSAILNISPNQRLPKLYSYLQNLVQVVSIQALNNKSRFSDSNAEHLAIVEAISNKDINKAESLLREHFRKMIEATII